ncbi:choice-of-anchor Q domain-containing protein [Flagellimonas sp.]|uniref:choice-of-anchor Q domain-containing protein n=1 Tax=Flagellimonas sp. TaxID=2058762 RepID=UPI003F4A36EA
MHPPSVQNEYLSILRPYSNNVAQKFLTYILCILLLSATVFWSSCREDFEFETNSGNLTFSKDTVFLDTVFTNIGSATYTLKVYNRLNQDISIPFVGLENGPSSSYRLNVDGVAGKEFQNVPLLARDSLFIFVETTFDVTPTGETEFLNTDRILFGEGSAQQHVDLVTLVKDAVFLYPATNADGTRETIPIGLDENGNEIVVEGFVLEPAELNFTNEKPYVIYGYAAVDNGEVLNVAAGARVHFHRNSGMVINSGSSLQITGGLSMDPELLENQVIFEGDRLEPTFADVPGQWGALWIRSGSVNNNLQNLTVKNATAGLIVEGDINNPAATVTLINTQITNSLDFNLWSAGARISASNSVFGGAGATSVRLGNGGDYQFVHSTIANYWGNGPRGGVALALDNEDADLQRAEFTNSIVDGSSRLELSLIQNNNFAFNFRFVHTAIQFNDTGGNFSGNPLYDFDNETFYLNTIINGDMDFQSPFQDSFLLGVQSDAIDAGDPSTLPLFANDILGNPRDANPDLGAYEFAPEN